MKDGSEKQPAGLSRRKALRGLGGILAVALVSSGLWYGLTVRTEPHLNRLPLIRQATSYTCGVAVLESILSYYGQDYMESDLQRELKADPDQGTNYKEIVRFARARGIEVDTFENMTLENLRKEVEAGRPVVVAFQAWGDHPENYGSGWEDGHYSIVVGVDERKIYLMDPSTSGNYAYILIPEFLGRWHDYYLEHGGRRTNLVHFGMVFHTKTRPVFNPSEFKPVR